MTVLLAPCGIDCAQCDAFKATAAGDAAALAAIAEKWSKEYSISINADGVRCHGCHATDGLQIGHCSMCGVRLCAIAKGYDTCAECASFGCEKLSPFFDSVPGGKERLQALRKA